jgi:hypothetical protein
MSPGTLVMASGTSSASAWLTKWNPRAKDPPMTRFPFDSMQTIRFHLRVRRWLLSRLTTP